MFRKLESDSQVKCRNGVLEGEQELVDAEEKLLQLGLEKGENRFELVVRNLRQRFCDTTRQVHKVKKT